MNRRKVFSQPARTPCEHYKKMVQEKQSIEGSILRLDNVMSIDKSNYGQKASKYFMDNRLRDLAKISNELLSCVKCNGTCDSHKNDNKREE